MEITWESSCCHRVAVVTVGDQQWCLTRAPGADETRVEKYDSAGRVLLEPASMVANDALEALLA